MISDVVQLYAMEYLNYYHVKYELMVGGGRGLKGEASFERCKKELLGDDSLGKLLAML